MNISLQNITKRFDATVVVNGVTLEIRDGEMFFLLGPSGCGKTTLLRLLAGFYPPDSGDIHFGGRRMNNVPTQERNTALVFQNYALWPHLTVFENVAYGLHVRAVAEVDLRTRVMKALLQVRMDSLANRKPAQLSGGQQQRVALARALVVQPDLLLFDEPLSNLDAKLRVEMRDEIRKLHAATRTTSLYVTHDQEEALSLADRIAVMHEGKLQQIGTPRDIYDFPANPFVASFIGEINLFPPESLLARAFQIPAGKRFGFRPERVIINQGGFEADVIRSTYLGSKASLILRASSGEEFQAWGPAMIAPGEAVTFTVPPDAIHEFAL